MHFQSGAQAGPEPDAVTRLLIEYDGTGFAGWASQPGLRTIQSELENGLATVLRQPVSLTVAGRTDAGVHAWGQVASYEGPTVRRASVNAVIPDDIAVLASEEAEPGFDARFDATSRAYCYRLLTRSPRSVFERGRALHAPFPLDRDALDACAAALVGRHDFTAFTPTETDHVRFEREVLAARWQDAAEGVLEFWIEADAFMRNMNRVLVGTMLEVAQGRRAPASWAALLEGAPRSAAGATAPPHGLYLAAVGYRGERLLPGPVAV